MPTLTTLLRALADLTVTEPRPEARATAAALRAGVDTDFPAQPPSPLDALIRTACALTNAHPAARLIFEAQAHLPWQASPAADRQPGDLAATKAVVTLLAPEGPIPAPDLRFGLFYQAPGIYYPLHAHEAAETYTILSGTVQWQAGDRRFPLAPGEAVHHPPNLPHAMRAGPDGFLAIWRWSGDIAFDSYRMLPDPKA
jgi:quercetin dioxygenase-like cupin family protein